MREPPKNLIGMQFGLLYVIEKTTTSGTRPRLAWLVECKCGTRKVVRHDALVSGRIKSCGCISSQLKRAKAEKTYSLVNQRFGRLLVLCRDKTQIGTSRSIVWKCRCDCGNIVTVRGSNLRTGKTQSCGCLLEDNWLPAGQAVRDVVLSRYKDDAARRQLEWSLSDDEFDNLIKGNCYYCNGTPNRSTRIKNCRGEFTYNGIDRVNNEFGYVKGNVVPCCYVCNLMKRTMTPLAFLTHLKKIVQHWDGRKFGVIDG